MIEEEKKKAEEEALGAVKGLFCDSAKEFEVVSAEWQDDARCVDVLTNVTIELDNSHFEYDDYGEKWDIDATNIVDEAQEKLYRYLINSGELKYTRVMRSLRYKSNCVCQRFRINSVYKPTFLYIYIASVRVGGPDYFLIDDDLVDECLYGENAPEINYHGEDDYEIAPEKVKIPIYLTVKFF